MTEPEPLPPDAPYASWLAACDDALARGAGGDLSLPPASPDPGVRRRLAEDVSFLRFVQQMFVRSTAPEIPTSGPDPSAPAGPALTSLGRFQIRRELGRGTY